MTFFVQACHSHRIYHCMTAHSKRIHTLQKNHKILHTKTFFAWTSHPRQIYCCITAHSTWNNTLLHNPTILHTKTFFAPACHLRKKILSTSKYNSNTHLIRNIYLFPFLGLWLVSGLRYDHPFARNWCKSLHANLWVAYHLYFKVLCNYHHTYKDGVMLDSKYSSQVLHTSEYEVLLGTTIKYYQRMITLRESRMRFHL